MKKALTRIANHFILLSTIAEKELYMILEMILLLITAIEYILKSFLTTWKKLYL